MACCYGMECDILGLLPRHLFQRLLTMHSSLNNQYQYQCNNQFTNNYHTLSTIPHHYDQDINVELITSNNKNNNNDKCLNCVNDHIDNDNDNDIVGNNENVIDDDSDDELELCDSGHSALEFDHINQDQLISTNIQLL